MDARLLGDTAERISANSRWEYEDLPYWGGEVDCCINSYTLANGAWLGLDMSANAEWFLEHQLDDGGWNCDWVEGAVTSSFHSTLNALIGLLDFEMRTKPSEAISAARLRGDEYLLRRKLMFRLRDNQPVGEWLGDLVYPFRWKYSILRALNYFRDASLSYGRKPDPRLSQAVETLASMMNYKGRWCSNSSLPGEVWFEFDGAMGGESKWLTYAALRVLTWWNAETTAPLSGQPINL